MRMIDADTVHRLLDYPGLVDALAQAHAGPEPLTGRCLLEPGPGAPDAGAALLVLPAWLPGAFLGVKMATVQPANAGSVRPTVQAVYQLFDSASGAPLAVIDGTALTLRKTAADSALGSRCLSRPGLRTMLMIGAGALAPHLIAAHRVARPTIERIDIWNRSTPARDALVEQLRASGLDARAAPDLASALEQAELVSSATSSTTALVCGARLRPGTHVDLVGSFTPAMRECDDDTVRRGALFVDHRSTTVGVCGDLAQPLARGVIRESDIRADLFELCGGRHRGRVDAAQITVYKNGGGAHLDLFTASHLAACLDAESC